MKKYINFDKWDNPMNNNDNKKKLNKLLDFLYHHGFDFYYGYDDFLNKWNEIINDIDKTAQEKSDILTNYLDEKWGLYDGWEDVYNLLLNLLNTE